MNEDICFSGGAPGADRLFGYYAKRAGHDVTHFSFAGHLQNDNIGNDFDLHVLSQKELNEADPYLKRVNKVLERAFPCRELKTTNLLRRDYYQVKNTKRVYAISEIDEDGLVKGGTAWAVHCAILLKVPEIYVFDQKEGRWFHWNYKLDRWVRFETQPAKPSGKYTGIGTRKINEIGIKAIRNLYEQDNGESLVALTA